MIYDDLKPGQAFTLHHNGSIFHKIDEKTFETRGIRRNFEFLAYPKMCVNPISSAPESACAEALKALE